MVDGGLAEHGVVLELRLAERRGVAGNDDELGLAGAEGLEGGLVTKSDLAGLLWKCQLCCSSLGVGISPGMRTLIVSANLALMLSAVFAPFFGAILLVFGGVVGRWSEVVVGRLAAEVGGSRIRLVRVCKSSSPARASAGAGGPRLSKRSASCACMLRDT